ncbi:MAG: RMD1 family protein [Polyangiaceae bacterium]|nr:RMD1 family protein [Polyangiaceae bacterium]
MNGRTFTATAFAYASRFRLEHVVSFFPREPAIRKHKTFVVAVYPNDGRVFAFDFGALVFFNVAEELREQILAAFWKGLTKEPHPPLREELVVNVREGSRIQVDFDSVTVPAYTPIVNEVIATVLAQSVALDYYDEDVQASLDRIQTIAQMVGQTAKTPRKQAEIVRFVGASIASQVEIISSLALLDKPDITWDDKVADDLHNKLRAAFEIGERYRALEAKIVTCREAVTAFLEMIQHRRAHLLEAMVIALILFEIVVGFLKLH